MTKMIQSKGARNAITMSSLVVFCRWGRRPAISRLVEEARMPESTSYKGLESKETCIRAFLENRSAMWLGWFQNEVNARFETTGGGLQIIADVLREWFEDSQQRGSAGKAIVSNRDFNGQNLEIAKTPKDQLRGFVRQLAVKMGSRYPDEVASAAVLIVERTIVITLMTGDLSELNTAQLLFQCLQHSLSVEIN